MPSGRNCARATKPLSRRQLSEGSECSATSSSPLSKRLLRAGNSSISLRSSALSRSRRSSARANAPNSAVIFCVHLYLDVMTSASEMSARDSDNSPDKQLFPEWHGRHAARPVRSWLSGRRAITCARDAPILIPVLELRRAKCRTLPSCMTVGSFLLAQPRMEQ